MALPDVANEPAGKKMDASRAREIAEMFLNLAELTAIYRRENSQSLSEEGERELHQAEDALRSYFFKYTFAAINIQSGDLTEAIGNMKGATVSVGDIISNIGNANA